MSLHQINIRILFPQLAMIVALATIAPPAFGDIAWSSLGSGVNGSVHALAWSGTELYAGGAFTTAGGTAARGVAKWDGAAWSALGSGVGVGPDLPLVYTLAVAGADVYVGGGFDSAGGVPASNVARWNGTSWSAVGSGTDGVVRALAVVGSDLYVGGEFTTAGGQPAGGIAKWNGSAWSDLGSTGFLYVEAIAVIGSDIYAAGFSSGGSSAAHVAKWNGTTWSTLGSGTNSSILALAVSGTNLYVGGEFAVAGGILTNGVARWDGASWSALGSGLYSPEPPATARSLAFIGTDLYVGGAFTAAGGVSANNIAKWDGTTWSATGTGTNDVVNSVASSSAGHLAVGGQFYQIDSTAVSFIAAADLDPDPSTPTATQTPVATATATPTQALEGGCEAAPVGCTFLAAKGSLAVKNNADAAKRKLAWTWSNGNDGLAQSDFGDPVAGGTAYKVCVYDQTAGVAELVMGAAIDAAGTCNDKPCWKAVSDKGWSYKNKDGNAAGITKVVVKGGVAGKPKIKVLAKGANVPAPRSGDEYFDQDSEVTVQIFTSNPVSCWSGSFDTSSLKKNDGTQFKSKNP